MSGQALEAVHPCPYCGGTGRWQAPPCEHDWRMVSTGFGNLRYACMNEDCEATLCNDCATAGYETCQERERTPA